jgi:hypothetical protein
MKALRECVDVGEHRVKHVEARGHPREAGLPYQIEHPVQDGAERTVLVADDGDRIKALSWRPARAFDRGN